MNVSQIGRFISRRRADLGLTQAQLAQRLDVTDKAVSKWERGKSLPDVALLSRVARSCGSAWWSFSAARP